jgi:hypothetical protein
MMAANSSSVAMIPFTPPQYPGPRRFSLIQINDFKLFRKIQSAFPQGIFSRVALKQLPIIHAQVIAINWQNNGEFISAMVRGARGISKMARS